MSDTVKRDLDFLRLAKAAAAMSHDPSTKWGAVLAGEISAFTQAGWNQFPLGVLNHACRWDNRDMKLKLVVHAEMAALLQAARVGHSIRGSTMYIVGLDVAEHLYFGSCPCIRCMVELIAAGVQRVVTLKDFQVPKRQVQNAGADWRSTVNLSIEIGNEAGMEIVYYPLSAI